jgi:hypothetical protein
MVGGYRGKNDVAHQTDCYGERNGRRQRTKTNAADMESIVRTVLETRFPLVRAGLPRRRLNKKYLLRQDIKGISLTAKDWFRQSSGNDAQPPSLGNEEAGRQFRTVGSVPDVSPTIDSKQTSEPKKWKQRDTHTSRIDRL